MSADELMINALDKCLETAEGEQRRLLLWMKAALHLPGMIKYDTSWCQSKE